MFLVPLPFQFLKFLKTDDGSALDLDVSKSVSKPVFATPSSSPDVIHLVEDNDSVSCDEYTRPVLEWGLFVVQ